MPDSPQRWTPLKAFLATARAALAAPPARRPRPLTLVVGNESADLDSLCSALLLAYIRTHSSSSGGDDGGSGIRSPPPHLHIPLCNIPRERLRLRPEFGCVLRRCALDFADVVTLSEVPGLPLPGRGGAGGGEKGEEDQGLALAQHVCLLLVDHNVLPPGSALARGGYAARVAGCVDHHADEGAAAAMAPVLRVVEPSGSCASLVVAQCRRAWEEEVFGGRGGEPGNREEMEEEERRLAWLALAPVLVDTANLRDAHKTTAHDRTAVSFLCARIGSGGATLPPDDTALTRWAAELAALKADLALLTYRDILRKDYKEWQEQEEEQEEEEEEEKGGEAGGGGRSKRSRRLGIASVPRDLATVLRMGGSGRAAKGDFVAELERWAVDRELDLVAVMTAFTTTAATDGAFGRELLVVARTEAGVHAAEAFVRQQAGALGLASWEDGRLDAEHAAHAGARWWRRCWVQSRVENSRKQVAPMLRAALRRQRRNATA